MGTLKCCTEVQQRTKARDGEQHEEQSDSHNNPGDQTLIKTHLFIFPRQRTSGEHCLCFWCLGCGWGRYGEVCCY